jgi:hypothetical protein
LKEERERIWRQHAAAVRELGPYWSVAEQQFVSGRRGSMTTREQFLGIVQDDVFIPLEPHAGAIGAPIRLTALSMQAAVPPESEELDLTGYEGKAIMVSGYVGGGWLYSAEVIDHAGPILTAVVRRVFGRPGEPGLEE